MTIWKEMKSTDSGTILSMLLFALPPLFIVGVIGPVLGIILTLAWWFYLANKVKES